MLTYEYYCPANGQTLQVRHGMSEKLLTWGKLVERAGLKLEDDTPADAPIQRNVLGGGMAFTKTDFTKPVSGSNAKSTKTCVGSCECH